MPIEFASTPSPAPTTGQPRPSTSRRSSGTRLLDAAAAVFATHGLAHSSVQLILKQASLGRGTFYRHFPNLDAAFIAAKREACDRLYRHVANSIVHLEDPRKQLTVGISSFLSSLEVLGDYTRVLFAERPSMELHRALRREILDRFCQLFSAGLVRAYKQGTIHKVPDELTIFAVVAALESVAIRFVEDGQSKAPRSTHQTLVDFCTRALCLIPETDAR